MYVGQFLDDFDYCGDFVVVSEARVEAQIFACNRVCTGWCTRTTNDRQDAFAQCAVARERTWIERLHFPIHDVQYVVVVVHDHLSAFYALNVGQTLSGHEWIVGDLHQMVVQQYVHGR